MAAAERIEVADASARERYELSVDGEVAGFAAHLARPGLIAFVHTEVDERVQGRALSRAQPADHATRRPTSYRDCLHLLQERLPDSPLVEQLDTELQSRSHAAVSEPALAGAG